MLLKVWMVFALLTSAAQSDSHGDPNVQHLLVTLQKGLAVVQNEVQKRTADVLKLRRLEENCCAVDAGQGIEDIKHRIIDVEEIINASTPQIDYVVNQVQKLWVEVRKDSLKTHSKEGEEKVETDSKDLITNAIINSTDAINEMLNTLKVALRETLDNSLYEMINGKDELGFELSYLENMVRDNISDFSAAVRQILNGGNTQFIHENIRTEEDKWKSVLRKAFTRTKIATATKFRSLKNMIKKELSNLSDEINNSKDASRKAFSNLSECHCKRVE